MVTGTYRDRQNSKIYSELAHGTVRTAKVPIYRGELLKLSRHQHELGKLNVRTDSCGREEQGLHRVSIQMKL
jgi:hypothetical protein